MQIYEKMKRDYVLFGLDEPFNLDSIVLDFYDENLKNEEIKNKVLDFIKFLLSTNEFKVISLDCSNKRIENLSEEIVLKQISNALDEDLDGDILWCIKFDFTEKGKDKAKEYYKKRDELRISTLKLSKNEFISLNRIVNLVKEEFKTDDDEEIKYEVLNVIPYIEDHEMIDKFLNINSKIINWDINSFDFKIELEREFTKYKDILFFKITQKGNDILKNLGSFGGDLHKCAWDHLVKNKYK